MSFAIAWWLELLQLRCGHRMSQHAQTSWGEMWKVLESHRCDWAVEIVKVKSLSCVPLFATLWTVAYQASLSHGIFQARIPEWVAFSFSRGASWPRDWTQVSLIAGRHFTLWATREAVEIIHPEVTLYLCSSCYKNSCWWVFCCLWFLDYLLFVIFLIIIKQCGTIWHISNTVIQWL